MPNFMAADLGNEALMEGYGFEWNRLRGGIEGLGWNAGWRQTARALWPWPHGLAALGRPELGRENSRGT
jgi:hypothetical protein